MTSIVEQIRDEGFAGPCPIIPPDECAAHLASFRDAANWPPLDWLKGWAACSPAFYRMAMHPELVRIATEFLGENVMVWGAYVRTQPAGQAHAWHTDIESSDPAGGCLSVWLGLEHTSQASTLQLISRSHRIGRSVQEIRRDRNVRREGARAEDVLAWARETESDADWIRPAAGVGDAIIFDGRLWHGSHNTSGETRVALILNYATPETKIRSVDFQHLEWPFRRREHPRPACVRIRGGTSEQNRFAPPPPKDSARRPTSRVDHLGVPLSLGAKPDWRPYPIFAGSTDAMPTLTCHTSVLRSGSCPHPPHAHDEEELLIMLDGAADLLLPDTDVGRRRLHAGELAYYPAGVRHTLEAVGASPANYLMFKWSAEAGDLDGNMGFAIHEFGRRLRDATIETGFRPRRLFEGPTRWLEKLHCHTSTLSAGAGYSPHTDAYDVAILMLEGEVETLGERVGPYGLAFHPAGEPHGIRNPGPTPAKYLVFEFHGRDPRR